MEGRVKEQVEEIEVSVKLQYMEALRLASYTSFNDRRSYEWKLSLAIWTAAAVLVAGLVQPAKSGEVFPFHGESYGLAATIVGALIVVMHICFNVGIARANSIDRLKERIFSDLIKSELALEKDLKEHPEKTRLHKLIIELPKPPESGRMQWWQWGHLAQNRYYGSLDSGGCHHRLGESDLLTKP